MKFTRIGLLAVAAASAVTLTACGGGDDSATTTATSAAGSPTISSEHNDADLVFVKDMIPHHEGALEMAELAADRAESAEVKDLASRIEGAQDPEIDLMRDMLEAWGQDEDAGHSMSGGMDMGDDAAELEPLEGAAFDRRFLELMTEHHESAVEMAETELADGENAEAKELAQEIIDAQKAEIAEMKQLLAA